MMKDNEFIALSPGTLLWQQINEFRLDDPDAVMPFSKKLARENKWDAAFTQRAIQEYKRFIYLCCISPTGASPSGIVDKVWHQHCSTHKITGRFFVKKRWGKKSTTILLPVVLPKSKSTGRWRKAPGNNTGNISEKILRQPSGPIIPPPPCYP